ncbi:unnamed protein product [Pleuronectes platessa]|uniref:Uncharacterized protein n=1 Tax=Pleuronectes platessa TaxID=8262 RepID=A0A9N7TM66_PLEPL|nr:unnamed protein product [Pleuronectes platessa]
MSPVADTTQPHTAPQVPAAPPPPAAGASLYWCASEASCSPGAHAQCGRGPEQLGLDGGRGEAQVGQVPAAGGTHFSGGRESERPPGVEVKSSRGKHGDGL